MKIIKCILWNRVYLNSGLSEIALGGQLLAGIHVRVVGALKHLLHLVQLIRRECGPIAAFFPRRRAAAGAARATALRRRAHTWAHTPVTVGAAAEWGGDSCYFHWLHCNCPCLTRHCPPDSTSRLYRRVMKALQYFNTCFYNLLLKQRQILNYLMCIFE